MIEEKKDFSQEIGFAIWRPENETYDRLYCTSVHEISGLKSFRLLHDKLQRLEALNLGGNRCTDSVMGIGNNNWPEITPGFDIMSLDGH